MKWILLILPTFAAACATNYNVCHCYNADKLPNNNATRTVCDGKEGAMVLNKKEYPDAKPGYYECATTTVGPPWWDNCDWKVLCQSAGATGSDSSCSYDCGDLC